LKTAYHPAPSIEGSRSPGPGLPTMFMFRHTCDMCVPLSHF